VLSGIQDVARNAGIRSPAVTAMSVQEAHVNGAAVELAELFRTSRVR